MGICNGPRARVNLPSHSGRIYLPASGEDRPDGDPPQDSEEEGEEEEEEVTGSEEDGLAFDGCAFEAILKGSQRASV